MFLVSLCLLCAAHTLNCLAGYFLFPSPPQKILSSLCILKSPESLPGGSCLGPLGFVCFSGNWRSSELDSLQFWTSDIQDLPILCRKFCTLFFLVSCTQKNALKSTQFSRYSITFSWTFYSFLQNWVITEVLVCPVYVLYEFIVLDNSIRILYLHVCFPVFPAFVDNCCVMDRTYHFHKSHCSKLARLHNLTSRTLTAIFKALALPFWVTWNAPISSQCRRLSRYYLAMSELISHCYENCLNRCEERWVCKLWGEYTSRRSQLVMWTSCGDITVTVQTFIVAIIRDIRTCIRI